MSDLPAPLTPPGVDLRVYTYMPLEFDRLFNSDTWVLGTAEQRVACLYLWCKSWHQVPAGSLPSDERILADLSRTGPRWRKLRDHCMRGWVLCSDQRFYHPVVVEKVVDAWEKLCVSRKKGAAGAAKRWPQQLSLGDPKVNESKGNEVGASHPPPTPFALPDWVPPDAWRGFVDMRVRNRKPLTDRAMHLTVLELDKLRAKGEDPGAVLDQSTQRNWLGVFAVHATTDARVAGGRQAAVESRNRQVVEKLKGGA